MTGYLRTDGALGNGGSSGGAKNNGSTDAFMTSLLLCCTKITQELQERVYIYVQYILPGSCSHKLVSEKCCVKCV
jgi:hypothetical protein